MEKVSLLPQDHTALSSQAFQFPGLPASTLAVLSWHQSATLLLQDSSAAELSYTGSVHKQVHYSLSHQPPGDSSLAVSARPEAFLCRKL